MQVAFVLRSGGVYTPKHVQALAAQVAQWLPAVPMFCLSDVTVPGVPTIPLQHKWPGWWSKLELFRPDIEGDILYFDLDTVIRGPLDDIAAINHLAILRDFTRDGVLRREGLQSSVMYLPHKDRAEVWQAFIAEPQRVMMECVKGGDQQFLERFWMGRAYRWQDYFPGQFASYKAHWRQGLGRECHVLCFHGKPRPWLVPEFAGVYL